MSYLRKRIFDDIFEFTRSSIGTYVDVNGMIRTAGVDEPRYSYDPITKEHLGILIEQSTMNHFTYSSTIGSYDWISTNTPLDLNAELAPNGKLEATRFKLEDTLNGDSTNVTYQTNDFLIGETWTLSVFAKADDYNIAALRLPAQFADNGFLGATFDLSDGSVIDVDNSPDAHATDFGNGWWRLSITGPVKNDGNGQVRIYVGDLDRSVVSSDNEGIFIWGAQLEQGLAPSSYIPAAGSKVTRMSDVLKRMLESEYSSNSGAVIITFAVHKTTENPPFSHVWSLRNDPSSLSPDISLRAETNNNKIPRIIIRTSDATAHTTTDAYTFNEYNQFITVGVSFETDNILITSDGNPANQDTTSTVPVDELTLLLIGDYFNGYIKEIKYYPHTLTATELETLTQ